MDTNKLKKPVESLQTIYAVIIAIAITESIGSAFNDSNGNFNIDNICSNLPALLTFFVLVVPFYQGMNRHLDKYYTENTKEKVQSFFLLIDFIFFCLEAILFVFFSKLLAKELYGFRMLWWLLVVDCLWALITNRFHRRPLKNLINWGLINLITLLIAYFIYRYCKSDILFKTWVFFGLGFLRTIIDYILNWEFYFPPMILIPIRSKLCLRRLLK